MEHYDNQKIANSANLLHLKIRHVFCGYVGTGQWKSCPPHNRLIYVFESGSPTGGIGNDDDFCPLLPHTWLFLPAFYEVRHEENPGLKLISIHFSLESYPGVELFAESKKILYGIEPDFDCDFQKLLQQSERFENAFLLQSVVWNILSSKILPNVPSIDHYRERYCGFAELLDRIQTDPCGTLSVRQMASIMKMGKESFVKHFKKETGISPKLFFNRIRAASAAEALSDPALSIREIAEKFHFSNEFYFSRFFKRYFNSSPAIYRKKLLTHQ